MLDGRVDQGQGRHRRKWKGEKMDGWVEGRWRRVVSGEEASMLAALKHKQATVRPCEMCLLSRMELRVQKL